MNNKLVIIVIASIIAVILVLVIAFVSWIMYLRYNIKEITEINENNNQSVEENVDNNETSNTEEKEDVNTMEKKTAVIYFSETGNTESIAKLISTETNAELIKIEPMVEYTEADLDYNSNCRANREQNDSSARPEIKNEIKVDEYDTIYLGYPIWWGTIPKIILTFIDTHNLDGKTVIPFCTSGSTGISQSERDLHAYNTNINWKDGKRFSTNASQSDIANWISGLEL